MDATGPLLAVAGAVVYFVTRQRDFWGDGYQFCDFLQTRQLLHAHILYLPAAALLQWAASPFGVIDSEHALLLLSALCGGASLWLTYAFGKLVLGAKRPALFAASLLGVLQGFWFHSTVIEVHLVHTAGSWMLLAGLVLHASTDDRSKRTMVLVTLGQALSPATHLSGIASAGVSWILGLTRRASRWLLPASTVGLAIFFTAYSIVRSVNWEFFKYYEGGFRNEYYPALLKDPARALQYLYIAGADLLSYTSPASAFLPVGLWLLAKRSRPLAATLALWFGAYLAICAPIGDPGMGGYYMATAAPQVWLATLALERLAALPARALLAALASMAPLAANAESAGARAAWSVAALAAVTLVAWPLLRAREPVPPVRRVPIWLFSMTIATAACTFSGTVLPSLHNAQHEHMDRVIAATSRGGHVLIAESDFWLTAKIWRLRLSMAGRPPATYVWRFDIPAEAETGKAAAAARVDVDRWMAASETVWLVGGTEFGPEAKHSRAFLQWLDERYAREPSPEIDGLWRLRPKAPPR